MTFLKGQFTQILIILSRSPHTGGKGISHVVFTVSKKVTSHIFFQKKSLGYFGLSTEHAITSFHWDYLFIRK